MNHALYLALLHSPILHQYLSAFAGTTGLLLRYLPSEMARDELSQALREDPFITIVTRTREGETACLNPILALISRLRRNLKPTQARNICGLIYVGVPLIVGGSTAGMLLAGPIAKRIPNASDCEKIARDITNWGLKVPLRAVRAAYCAVPVIHSSRLKSAITLLSLLANQLAESVHGWLLTEREREPPCVAAAKDFIQKHVTDQLTLQGIARHVCLSPDHFGKIFKKSTHMTVGECISRIRVEHVKQLLPSESCRVMEAAFESGFQSVAQFNRVFKKYVGVNPSQYRASFRAKIDCAAGCMDAGKRAGKPAR
jgi:AraC-like DNA-binding protein/ligand-binding sensor protein